MKNPLFDRLISQGLSESTVKVYLVLLEKKSASLSELHKSAGIRQNKIGEVVNNLVRQGLCTEKRVGRRRYFDIIEPEKAFRYLKANLENRMGDLDDLTASLNKIYQNTGDVSEPFEYIKTIHGNENIHRHYCDLVRNAKEEILVFSRPPFACYDEHKTKEQENEYFSFIKRGGRLLILFELNSRRRDDHIHKEAKLEKSGAQVRIVDNLPLKMMVFDRKEVLVAQEELLTMSGELLMASIRQDAIAEAFRALFAFFWNHALDIETWKEKGMNNHKFQTLTLPDLQESHKEKRL